MKDPRRFMSAIILLGVTSVILGVFAKDHRPFLFMPHPFLDASLSIFAVFLILVLAAGLLWGPQ